MAEADQLFLSDRARELYNGFTLKPEKSMMIVGSIYGDGSLLMDRKSRSPFFYENHCMEQLEYLKWKASMFGRPDGVRFRIMSHGYCKGKSIPYFQIRDRAFIDFEKMFYVVGKNGRRKKVVTKETLELLVGSALALAVLYQDDGEYDVYSNQAILNTCDFTIDENKIMERRFEELLRAPVRVKIKRQKYPRLVLSSKATDEFIKIVKPYVHPIMRYKIDQDISHYLDQQIVEKFRKNYRNMSKKQIAREVGLTLSETYIIGYRLGLTEHSGYVRYRDKPFTEQEKEYILNNYNESVAKLMAEELHTTTKYLRVLIHKMQANNLEEGKAGESICVQYNS
jgi:hypothetical protein